MTKLYINEYLILSGQINSKCWWRLKWVLLSKVGKQLEQYLNRSWLKQFINSTHVLLASNTKTQENAKATNFLANTHKKRSRATGSRANLRLEDWEISVTVRHSELVAVLTEPHSRDLGERATGPRHRHCLRMAPLPHLHGTVLRPRQICSSPVIWLLNVSILRQDKTVD